MSGQVKGVAIKKNKYVFNDQYDARNILREMKLLSYFTHYKYDCIAPKAEDINKFAHIYVIMPLSESTLLDIINNKTKIYTSIRKYSKLLGY